MKVLEENIGSRLFDIGLSDFFFFLDMSPQARETKAKIIKWDDIKLKRFCTANYNKTKRPLFNGRRYLQIIYLRG